VRFDCGWSASYLASFVQQQIDYGSQCAQEFSAIQRLNQGLVGSCLNFNRELVKASSVMGRQIASQASKTKNVIARAANPVFGLPKAAAFYTKARPRRVMGGVPEQLLCRHSRDGWFLAVVAKKDSEFRPIGTETGGWRNRKVDLKTSLQQQNPK
jgi:hypothetical protein